MGSVRSILWVGPGRTFEAELAARSPGLDVVWECDVERALSLAGSAFDAAVLDADDADAAIAGVRRLRRRTRRMPILVRIGVGDSRRVPELLEAGAADVALREADGNERAPGDGEIAERIAKLAGGGATPRAARRRPAEVGIIGESAAMRAVFDLVLRASQSSASVLVTGETGTGKELIAHAIHQLGPHPSRPFVALNCAAFPDTLLESELFGHTRGAFTGADRDKKGLFEVADGGTLFLDEVSETSPPFQAKLLRALQEGEVRPVGGARAKRVEVRVIAATNRRLREDVARQRFREDLYYRLAVFPIEVPPLRDRTDDVLPLARHFLELHGRREGKTGHRLSRDAEHLLLVHPWPGNVRELENEIQRALALADPGEALSPGHLSERLLGILEPIDSDARPGETLREVLGRIEAWLLRRALDGNGGRRAITARQLGITREGLYKKMKRYGIE